MAKRELTEEEKQRRREALARGREVAKANREARDAALLSQPPADAGERRPPSAEPLSPDRRSRMLEDIDPEIAELFTDDELAQIEAEENEVAAEERRAKAKERIRATARQRARVENDLISADVLRSDAEKKWLAEEVTFRVSLPDDGAGADGRAGFRVNGFLYQIGHEYKRPRHVFISLHANHYGALLQEVRFRTLDQHKPGQEARFIVGRHIPQFEVAA